MKKTTLQVYKEMKEQLENDAVKLQIIADYKKFLFEQDPVFKGNTEAEKELGAAEMSVDRTNKMLEWLKTQMKTLK